MKKLIILAALTFGMLTFAQAQTVNGVKIDSIKTNYIELVGTGKMYSTDVIIQIEFGQHRSGWNIKKNVILDKDGKRVDFHSMVDALNFFSQYGFEFIAAYEVPGGTRGIYHYLMKRKTKNKGDKP